ncbi:MAG: Peptidase [Erysipelotrichaceae bacterium]|nr:MAG: Peptidase [Erysipelotrichaceae bacterium]
MRRSRKLRKEVIFVLIVIAGIFISNITISAYKEISKIKAYQMSVDGKVWFVVQDKLALENIIETYKSSYLKDIKENAEQVVAKFDQDIQITEVRVEKDTLISLEEAQIKITAIEKEATIYTVVSGDSFWAIAKKHDIPLATIINLNPNLDPELIFVGTKIVFEPKDPVLDVVVSFQTTMLEDIPYDTEYIKDASLYSGSRVVVKKGQEGSKEVTYGMSIRNGYVSETIVLKELEKVAPVGSVIRVGTMRTLSKTSNSNFGVVSGQLSSNYGWRNDPISGIRKFHNGLDIASNYGTPIYSYTNGTVSEAGWDNTKGYYVMIQHNGGIKTIYLHMSKVLVSKGQSVKVGQKIGQVGSTGYSTGSHLHFSVMKNGSYLNPWDYL